VRLVLASASPRRADLLRAAGFDFTVRPAAVDESVQVGESAERHVLRLALAKADAVDSDPENEIVLAADTVVVLDETILGKPRDEVDAAAMLQRLSGRSHAVWTGVVVRHGRHSHSAVEQTRVHFVALPDDEIAWYVASGEPMDKAGAYAIQGRASRFVERIEGSYSNVVGLPVHVVWRLLSRFESSSRL
jgi:septum formation protein